MKKYSQTSMIQNNISFLRLWIGISSVFILTGCSSNQGQLPVKLSHTDPGVLEFYNGQNVREEFQTRFKERLYTIQSEHEGEPELLLEYNPDLFNYVQNAQAILSWENETVNIPFRMILLDTMAPEITVRIPEKLNGNECWNELIQVTESNDTTLAKSDLPFMYAAIPSDFSAPGWVVRNKNGELLKSLDQSCLESDKGAACSDFQTPVTVFAWDGHGNISRKDIDLDQLFQQGQ